MVGTRGNLLIFELRGTIMLVFTCHEAVSRSYSFLTRVLSRVFDDD